ncbi:MAG: hypothetical protein WBP85_10615 [Terracidiphilus sp.]
MRFKCGAIAGWLAFTFMGGALAQSANNASTPQGAAHAPAPPAEAVPSSDGTVLREIRDPTCGDLWLLVRDPNRPAGPGRLMLARQGTSLTEKNGNAPVRPAALAERTVIHTGDALVVEEHSAVVDVRLEATALGPAAKGAFLCARLKIGGKVVRVEAVSAGRAVFGPESEVQP